MKKNRAPKSGCIRSVTATTAGTPRTSVPSYGGLYNSTLDKGESIRVFPLSNWTELDVWQYVYRENIPVVPLYFAKETAGGRA